MHKSVVFLHPATSSLQAGNTVSNSLIRKSAHVQMQINELQCMFATSTSQLINTFHQSHSARLEKVHFMCVCVCRVTGARQAVYPIIRPLREDVLKADCTPHVIYKGIVASVGAGAYANTRLHTLTLGGLQTHLKTNSGVRSLSHTITLIHLALKKMMRRSKTHRNTYLSLFGEAEFWVAFSSI